MGLVVGPLLAVLALWAVPDMQPEASGAPAYAGALTAATLVLMGVWWMTEALPLAVTALLPLVVLPVAGAAPIGDVAAPYANKVIFLFFGGFVLAIALQRWDVHLRIALGVVRLVGTAPRRLVLGMMLATALLSMWVSNTATAVMMLPIGVSVLALLGRERGEVDGRLSAALMLGIAYAATIGSFGTIIASPPNALLVGYMSETYGIEISFGQWMAVGLPLSVVFLLLAWLLLTRVVFRFDPAPLCDDDTVVRTELERLGPMGRPQRRVVAVFVLAAVSWIALPILWRDTPVTDEVVAILVAFLLFLLPSGEDCGGRLLDWSDTRELPWGILLLFGGGLALASQITSSGLSRWIGERAHGLGGLPTVVVVAVVCLLTVAMTEFMSNTATAATLLPIMSTVGASLGYGPLLLAVPVALAAGCTFMMPAATPPNAIAYSSGYVRVPDMMRAGAPLSVASVLLVTLTVTTLASWVLGIPA
ncbi:SLC13 family permease [Cellulomonas dongxiuzhuiae]|uniref:Sodium-dependent dicarboxylate transporter SdcS n=1 Tax=Cellulomonas dongxiuzhuiae TaxID=2819979 RepID=A0ABX8GG14_9CELL|nr:DASS family sodium-coupled anion symporter [Cellulomonas dongxiuzhuiae]MBO3086983.1 DASS family sodium-coupled anion symporter [Cellulomonas dongxiuzhuiae]MBO3093659.1 DASS family sodium-coupled anion symporter [Cellulomonas dongxiuzhuiae]QWC14773.1 DASS family sodium-coupled anion symporter [Cellulomonas dongxiuzhuiae]